MRDLVAMVLAGGRVEELSKLTVDRPKAAVPFGGQYRIIDFALSSLMHADVERVGVLSLYRPSSLIGHVGIGEPWDLTGRGRGVKILPPYTAEADSRWYSGTADAVFQNLMFIQAHQPRDVLILSGDHIYCMDFRPFIAQHRETDADLTMVVKRVPPEQGRGRYGFAEVDSRSRLTGYQEKPDQPRSDLCSLTIYLFNADVLVDRLDENQRAGSTHQLYREVLPEMVARDKVYAFKHEGYWNYTRSVEAYHRGNMDLLGDQPLIRLAEWGIRTRQQLRGLGDLPPARLEGDCSCTRSMVSPGVHIRGEVVHSVLSPGVRVEPGARVVDSVVMHDTVIGPRARVERAVLDKSVRVGAGARIGERSCEGGALEGIAVVGKSVLVPEGDRIGPGEVR